MTKSDKKEEEKASSKDKDFTQKIETEKKETPENKLKILEEKLLRTMAEMENQRRRFEKERQEAFEFGGFNFAKESLSLIDNIERAVTSFKNDDNLKSLIIKISDAEPKDGGGGAINIFLKKKKFTK